MLRAAAYVQSRLGSTRCPGKSLAELWRGRSVLELLLERLSRASFLDAVVVATTRLPGDDEIERLARRLGLACVRGEEADVLGRFALAAEQVPASIVVRVCADNPLTDPARIDELIAAVRERSLEYAYNNRAECGFPDGVGAEALSRDLLLRLARTAQDSADREHVTLAAYRSRADLRSAALTAPPALSRPQYRLDVDCPRDLGFLRALCLTLPQAGGPHWSTEDMVSALDSSPDLLSLREPRKHEA